MLVCEVGNGTLGELSSCVGQERSHKEEEGQIARRLFDQTRRNQVTLYLPKITRGTNKYMYTCKYLKEI